MSHTASDEAYAVIQTSDDKLDLGAAAKVLAEPLDCEVGNLRQMLSQRSGIIAENLIEQRAKASQVLLCQIGCPTRLIPQTAVVDVPDLLTLKAGRPTQEGFVFMADDARGMVAWGDILWIDFLAFSASRLEPFEDTELDLRSTGELGFQGMRRVQTERLVITQKLCLDFVSYEPWRLMRIPDEHFDFAATGLNLHPARRQNLRALAAALACNANESQLGPGLQLASGQSQILDHRLPSEAVYRSYLRWKLTLMFLEQ